MDWSGENRTLTSQRNPLLINTVVNCVFEYLSAKDLKQCRAVCQEWNYLSMKILNERSTVKLDSKERMTNFLEFYKDYDTQKFPFTSFHLIFSYKNGNTEEYEKMLDLFNTLRENIITVIIEHSGVGDKLCLTPLIEIATNLVRLTLSSSNSVVALDKLSKVKYLSLDMCCVNLDSFENRIAPLTISLNFVTFKRNENALQEIRINDYIDFSVCSEIQVRSCRNSDITFDMSRDIVSARKVFFHQIRMINWRETRAKLDKRMLLTEKHTGIRIQQLCVNYSELNLSGLPKSLEKLALEYNTYSTINCVPVDLPNLKYLFLQPAVDDITADMSPAAYDMGIITSMFRLCPKLVDMTSMA